MNKQAKPFLKNAVILTVALGVVILFMEEWGVAQILIVLFVGLLATGQWLLWLYMKKH